MSNPRALSSDTSVAARPGFLHGLMLLSGFAGLGYEMVWTKMLAVALGHEIVAVLAVIAAFFTGLAIGAWLLDATIRRSRWPGRWYAALECVIGVWALLLIPLIPAFNTVMPAVIGEEPAPWRHWASVFLGTLVLLLPATAAMGATLPAMERLFSALRQDGWAVGGLYAANTLGAVAGTMLTVFLLAPLLGFTMTLMALAAVNFACAALMLAAAGGRASGPAPVAFAGGESTGGRRLGATLFLTGLIGIGYEVVVIRVLSQVLENTVYTFASLLSVYLFGTALGAAIYQRYSPRRRFRAVLAGLLQGLAVACLVGVVLLWASEALHYRLTDWLGNGYLPAVTGEVIVALVVFLLPTLFMGALFSHLAQASRDDLGLGRAIGLNTLGSATAPLLFGVVLLPLLGSKTLLLLLAIAYLFLIPPGKSAFRAATALPAGLAAILFLFPADIRFVSVPEGGEIISYDEGIMATVSVVRDASDVRYLKVNNHYTMGSSVSGYSDRRQTHLPLLMHPAPRDVLYLGIGTGSTFAASAVHPGVRATGVELIPEVMPTIGHFGPSAEAYTSSDRFRLAVSDARRYVGATDTSYDVIIAEVFHPSRDGAGSLYTVEHFEAIRDRLRDEGLFCQWLPLFQLDLDTLRTIIRSFLAVFPDGEAHLAHFSLGQPLVALVGRRDGGPAYYRGWLTDRVSDPGLIADLNSLRVNTDFALLGGFLGAGEDLRRFAAEGPLNTDDRPLVTFRAPAFLYGGPEPAWLRLLELLRQLDPDPAALVDDSRPGAGDFASRLAAYWRARDAYLEAGVGVDPVPDPRRMLDQIGGPLLSVVRISNDFVPAYRPLLELARELYPEDPALSRQLLEELELAGPERTEATALRRRLFGR